MKTIASYAAMTIVDLEQENERCCDAARKAEKIGNQVGALLVEKTRLQEQLNQLQQVIATYGGVNGIDKLKEQNKRLKSGNTEKDARISQLERDNSKARHDLTTAQRQSVEAHTKIDLLQRQLAHDTGSGLNVQRLVFDDAGANGNRHVHVTRVTEIAAGTAVQAPLGRL